MRLALAYILSDVAMKVAAVMGELRLRGFTLGSAIGVSLIPLAADKGASPGSTH